METYTSQDHEDLYETRRALINKGVGVSLVGWNPATGLYTFNTTGE